MMLLFALFSLSFLGPILSNPVTTSPATADLDFFKILPRKEIEDLANQHLKNDEGFRAALLYMQGNEFETLMDNLSKKQEWTKLKEFLKDLNINVDIPVHCLRSYLRNITIGGKPTVKPSLQSFIVDVSQVVPTSKILSIWHAKMADPGFEKVFEKLSSNESKKIVEDALKTEEVRKLILILTEMGLDLKQAISALFTALGWGDFKM